MQDIFILEERAILKRLKKAYKVMLKALFATQYIAEIIAIVLVLFSLVLATYIPNSGIFLTSQSDGMTKYHRWLYDIFVLASCVMMPTFYFWLKRNENKQFFRIAWRDYIRINAEYKFYRFKQAELKQKKVVLQGEKGEYLILLLFILGPILLYSLVTPIDGARKGNFIIQTWWPLNAVIITGLYYGQFWLCFRLFSSKEIMTSYRLLIKSSHKNNA